MNWLRNFGIALAGILVAVGLSMLGRDGRAAKRAEQREQEYLADASDTSLKKAFKEEARAKAAKQRARETAKRTKEILDKRSENDPDMAKLLAAYNRPKRVRK
ncbi:MAG: hypothetical protein ACR2PS_05530 [Pseudomonadales bacterium]